MSAFRIILLILIVLVILKHPGILLMILLIPVGLLILYAIIKSSGS